MRFTPSTTPELIPPLEMPATPLRPYPERSRWPGRFVRWVVLAAIGLAAAEAVCWFRDDGAFPYLNCYVSDPVLGVRLMPGATERVAFAGQRVTEVRIHRDGYRGAELPPPASDEVVVVGDAQVFGLGVEEHETFAAVLGRTLSRQVTNAGVPTYGPPEIREVIVEQLAKRRARTVVLAINLVDDAAESQHRNVERHVAWDGWAVRKATAPAEITEFPGRALLYRQSHLWFALRTWRHAMGELDERSAVPDAPSPDAAATEPVLGSYVREVQRVVQGAGARLVVAILPGARGGSGRAEAAALVELGRGLGVSVLDAGPVLAAAEPGAFLDKDVHLAPKGHAAVAAALARVLLAPAPP